MSDLAPAHFRTVLAAGSKSFSLASRFLPAGRRDDAAVVYTFCRTVDDTADEASDPIRARDELQQVRADLEAGASRRPVVRAFLEVANRRGIDLLAAQHLVDGALSDLALVGFRTDAELIRYCYQVAGTVGLMMCGVLGVRSTQAFPFAVDMGIAMQLTNIVRDVREDALRGRVYLPSTRLTEVGLERERLVAAARATEHLPELAPVVRDLFEMGERYYRSADRGLRYIPARPRWAILVASRVYRRIGWRLVMRHGAQPMHGRTVVPQRAKLWVAATALVSGLNPARWGCTAPPVHQADLHTGLSDLPGVNRRAVAMRPRLEAVT